MQKMKRGDAAATAPAKIDERARLRYFAGEFAKAQEAVAAIDASQDRLIRVIEDAKAADEALQAAVAEDGGVSLAAYSAGQAADSLIGKLINAKEISAKAAAVASSALPDVKDKLAAARAEVARLQQEKFDATIVFLKMRAREKNSAYHSTFAALSNLYDTLSGIAIAVSATGHAAMETTALPVAIQAPGFNMSIGPSHGPSELVMLSHTPGAGEARVAEVTAAWMAARERLLENPDANLDDLIGPQVEKGDEP